MNPRTMSGSDTDNNAMNARSMSGLNATTSAGDVFLNGDPNAFTGTNTFNNFLPTSTVNPAVADIAGNTLLNKNAADKLYGSGSGDVTQAGNNVFTGTNSFNVNRPTSTLTSTPASTDFITKADADTLYNTQITTNTANITTNTSNIATNTSNIATNTTNITTNTNNITTLDGEVVKLSGNQTIADVKTFSSLPECSTAPTTNDQLANKLYVDNNAGTPTNMVTTDTAQTITGQKTFNHPITYFPNAISSYRILQSDNTSYIEQSGSSSYIQQTGTSSYIQQTGTSSYIEQTQTGAKITTQGKIGIGTSSPTEKLHVVGTALIQGTSSVLGTTVLQGSSSTSTPTLTMGTSPYQKGFAIFTDPYIRCVGVQSGMQTHNQYCALACGTFYAANAVRFGSDDRIKHNEQEIPDALDLIDELKPYKYKKSENIYDASYNGDISGNWEWEIGLIAQDILKIPYLSFAVGNDPDNSIHTLNYATFIGVLIQGVKDLNEKNQELDARIKTLEQQLQN